MGLVKTGRRLAEDGSPHHAAQPESAPYQGVRKCCQCGNVASSNVASFQLGGSFTYCNKSGRAMSDVSDDALRTFTVIELSASLRLNYGAAMWYHTTL